MFTGKIIRFFEHKEIVSGVCLEEKGSRIHVLCEGGREMNLNSNRVLHCSAETLDLRSDRGRLLEQIGASTARQRRLMEQVCAGELWEALEEKERLFDPGELAAVVFGSRATADHEAAVLRALVRERVHFKLQGPRLLAHSPAQVARLRKQTEKELQRQREIEEAVSWLASAAEGHERHCSHRDRFIGFLKDFVTFGKEAPRYRETREILDSVGVTDQKACFDLLVRIGACDQDENLLLQRHQISHVWPESVLREAAGLQKRAVADTPGFSEREDLTGLDMVSIDDPATRDIDDAVSFEFRNGCLRLGIHITDAASWISPGSLLDREASRRGTTLYLPEGKIPMIPPALSENMLSLRQGETRRAVSFFADISSSGNMESYRSTLSVIRVGRNLSYEDADAETGRGGGFSRLYDYICRLRRNRLEAGATWVLIPELQIRVDRDRQIALNLRDRETPGQLLVAECMILANYCASLLFRDRQFPALYRKQAEPLKKTEFGPRPTLLDLFSQRKNFSRVEISTRPGPHSTLGLPSYTSISSPLRKYLDLVAQRQLISLLHGSGPCYTAGQLTGIASAARLVLAKTALVSQERKLYWIRTVLAGRVGETLPALVLETRPRGRYSIILPEYVLDLQVRVPEGVFLSPGDAVRVRLEQVDPFSGTVEVRLAD